VYNVVLIWRVCGSDQRFENYFFKQLFPALCTLLHGSTFGKSCCAWTNKQRIPCPTRKQRNHGV